jgi:polyketide cyclase/dehydrase/lipid transport protein
LARAANEKKGVRKLLIVETSIVINRPVEDVFAVLSDLENNPTWSSVFLEAGNTSQEPIGVGTTWRVVQKAFGQRIEGEVEVTEYEPNRQWAQQVKAGPFPAKIWQTYEPGGFFKLAEPLLKAMIKRGIEADLANLKDMMEAHAL